MSIPKTEERNQKSMHIDKMATLDAVQLIITENYEAVRAAENAAESIAQAVEKTAAAFADGHRLFYAGAGTSGRLGVLDASECPPTFGVSPDLVCGILAGGKESMFRASEGAEDSFADGLRDAENHGIQQGDVVVGLSAAGGAKYVCGVLTFAGEHGCTTVAVSSNEDSAIMHLADIRIFTDTGAEVITGSTRLKAGTAQKVVLNAISTAAMIRTGHVYENMMINLSPTNEKLRARVVRIVCEILHCTEKEATDRLEAVGWNIRKAVE